MATGLFRISKKPIGVVAEEDKQNRGRGWGVTAMSLGIKPVSPEFIQLKANARKGQQKQELVRVREHDCKTKDEARGKAKGKGKKK